MLDSREGWLRDEAGRAIILRGCNLGGDCKTPYRKVNALPSLEEFYDYRGASFTGRPFPEDEADEHLDRLVRWGFNVVRFLVTWEGLEPKGPGQYDDAYYDYIERIVAKASDRGLKVFIDPHQDVWSRWTGGDGAPAWTLEKVGFSIRTLHASGAAFVHEEAGDPYPRMLWPANYNRLACATMFTLFFAGDDFAPALRIDGQDAKTFLQGHYIAAVARLAGRLAGYDNIIGVDSLNEPGDGFIGLGDIGSLQRAMSRNGPMPSPFEAMMAGSGYPVSVDVYGIRWGGQRVIGQSRLGEPGLSAWADGARCVWRNEGVWDEVGGKPVLLKPDHFATVRGKTPDFVGDYLQPFTRSVGEAVSKAAGSKRFFLFMESVPNQDHPRWTNADTEKTGVRGVVNAGHWYDGITLTIKLWTGFLAYDPETGRFYFGGRAVRRYFAEHLARIRERGLSAMDGASTLIGEFGLPYDMNGAKAYRSGNYALQVKALSAYYDALDASLLSATIWNYTAGNTHARGDGWNGEDLSVFNRDDFIGGRSESGDSADAGGRALRGFVRPFARVVAGTPTLMRFSARSGRFELEFTPDGGGSSEIYVPSIQYPNGFSIAVKNCSYTGEDVPGGFLILVTARSGSSFCRVEINKNKSWRHSPSE